MPAPSTAPLPAPAPGTAPDPEYVCILCGQTGPIAGAEPAPPVLHRPCPTCRRPTPHYCTRYGRRR